MDDVFLLQESNTQIEKSDEHVEVTSNLTQNLTMGQDANDREGDSSQRSKSSPPGALGSSPSATFTDRINQGPKASKVGLLCYNVNQHIFSLIF